MTLTGWKQGLMMILTLCGSVGPYIAALETWSKLATPFGIGGLLVVLGAWGMSHITYSPLDTPIGSPSVKP